MERLLWEKKEKQTVALVMGPLSRTDWEQSGLCWNWGVLGSVGDHQDCFHLPLSSFHPSVLSSDGSGTSGHVIPAELQDLGGVS